MNYAFDYGGCFFQFSVIDLPPSFLSTMGLLAPRNRRKRNCVDNCTISTEIYLNSNQQLLELFSGEICEKLKQHLPAKTFKKSIFFLKL